MANAGHLLALVFLYLAVAASSAAVTRLDLTRVARPFKASLSPSGPIPPLSEFLLSVSIGTPPQPVQLLLDTGSEVVWTQASSCSICVDGSPIPRYDSAISSTFTELPCNSTPCQILQQRSPLYYNTYCPTPATCAYVAPYGDGSISVGHFGEDTFTFSGAGGDYAPSIAFGVSYISEGPILTVTKPSGVAGFGRSNLSLVSQLGFGSFSYCFSYESMYSTLLLGATADDLRGRAAGAQIQTTPMLRNTANYPIFYYVSLKGITVGATLLPIPESTFAINATDGSGGVIIDSGTTVTSLAPAAFKAVGNAFDAQLNLSRVTAPQYAGLICYEIPSTASASEPVAVPALIFHLESADLDLPRGNYVYEDYSERIVCVAMIESRLPFSLIGSFQQQNMEVLFDIDKEEISFVPARCDLI